MNMTIEQISGVLADLSLWVKRTIPESEHATVLINGEMVNLKRDDIVRFLSKLSKLMVLSDFRPMHKEVVRKNRILFERVGLCTYSKPDLYQIWMNEKADDYCSFREFETCYLILTEEKKKNEH